MKTTPNLMGDMPVKKNGKIRKTKGKSADNIADELEGEAKRLLTTAMRLRGKDRLQIRVKEEK